MIDLSTALLLAALASALYFVWCLIRAVSSKARPGALLRARRSAVAFAVLFVLAIPAAYFDAERLAGEKGYDSSADMRRAESEGLSPTELKAKKALEERDRLANVETEALAEETSEAPATPAAEQLKAEEDKICRNEITCWGEKAAAVAAFRCTEAIERQAKFVAEWTDGWTEPKFSRYRWADKDAGIVTLLGDKIKFQNGFGAWSPMIYECDIHPETELVSETRVYEGRL